MSSSKENLKVKGWYFGINENVSIKAGVKNNQIGGVYSCPKAEEGTRGKVYVIWEDNRRSIASLDSSTLENFNRLVEIWRKSSFVDEEAPQIYKADVYPKVNLFDTAVHKLVYEDQSYIFNILEKYINNLCKRGINNIDASVSATSFQQHIRNSAGLQISNVATSFSTHVYGDEVYGKSYLSRRLIDDGEINYLIDNVASTVEGLKNPITIEGGIKDVLLLPEVAESFIKHYLISNLKGSQVYNRRSAFSMDDFNNNNLVMADHLNLNINTTIDFCQGAYISTFEGVPGGNFNFVEAGRLKSPILDLKYSNLMGLSPTPFPAGKGSTKLYSTKMKTYEELIKEMKDGVIVCDVLGMHTQDATSGNYSLTAPNCIRVENGELKEACKTVISGNFFEVLKQETTQLGTAPYEDNPCILLKSRVTGEK